MEPNHETSLDPTEIRRKNGIIPVSDSMTFTINGSSHHTEYLASSPNRFRHSVTSALGHHRDSRGLVSSRGHSRGRGSSPGTAGGDGGRSRSHSSTSTTSFLALQDNVSESSRGGFVGPSHNGGNDVGAAPANRPPSPSIPTVGPIVPSPLSQTVVASPLPEGSTGQAMSGALTRVEEVAGAW